MSDMEMYVPSAFIPRNDIEQALLKKILDESIFNKSFDIGGKIGVEGWNEKYEARFVSVYNSVWDAKGRYHASLDISPKDVNLASMLTEGEIIDAQIWFDVDTTSKKVEIWWGIKQSEWGSEQINKWPSPPILFVPASTIV